MLNREELKNILIELRPYNEVYINSLLYDLDWDSSNETFERIKWLMYESLMEIKNDKYDITLKRIKEKIMRIKELELAEKEENIDDLLNNI